MSVWIRQDVDIHDHPDLIDAAGEADGWALVAWQTSLRVIKAHGKDGAIDPKWLSGAKLARYSLWGPSAAPHLDAARDSLIAHGLLRVEDGRVRVPGWSSYQIDPRPAGRTRVGDCNRVPGTDRDETGQTGTNALVPGTHSAELGHTAYGTGRDVTLRDETGDGSQGGAGGTSTDQDPTDADRHPDPTPGPSCPPAGGDAPTGPPDPGPGGGGPRAGVGPPGPPVGGLRDPRPGDVPDGALVAQGPPPEPHLTLTPSDAPARPKKPRAGAAGAEERLSALAWLWAAWERGPQKHGCPAARPRAWDEATLRKVEIRCERSGQAEVEQAIATLAHPWSGDWRPSLLWSLTTGWSRTVDGTYSARSGDAAITHTPYPLHGVDIGMLPDSLRWKLVRDTMILSLDAARTMLREAVKAHQETTP